MLYARSIYTQTWAGIEHEYSQELGSSVQVASPRPNLLITWRQWKNLWLWMFSGRHPKKRQCRRGWWYAQPLKWLQHEYLHLHVLFLFIFLFIFWDLGWDYSCFMHINASVNENYTWNLHTKPHKCAWNLNNATYKWA